MSKRFEEYRRRAGAPPLDEADGVEKTPEQLYREARVLLDQCIESGAWKLARKQLANLEIVDRILRERRGAR